MIAERINGVWVISATVDGHLVTRRYDGYTKQEAIQKFKDSNKKKKAKK